MDVEFCSSDFTIRDHFGSWFQQTLERCRALAAPASRRVARCLATSAPHGCLSKNGMDPENKACRTGNDATGSLGPRHRSMKPVVREVSMVLNCHGSNYYLPEVSRRPARFSWACIRRAVLGDRRPCHQGRQRAAASKSSRARQIRRR